MLSRTSRSNARTNRLRQIIVVSGDPCKSARAPVLDSHLEIGADLGVVQARPQGLVIGRVLDLHDAQLQELQGPGKPSRILFSVWR